MGAAGARARSTATGSWSSSWSWLGFCAWFIFKKWLDIRYFGLGDTDDNMRMMQVRALLHGQGWFDLRQYRLNPPFGANIHWSRLVDLPIAGLILALAAVARRARGRALGGRDRAAAALSAAAVLARLTARRLIDPARLSARAARACSSPGRPTACSCPSGSTITAGSSRCWRSSIAAIADPKRLRGGLTLGIVDRAVAGDRARDADLSRHRRRGDGAVLGRMTQTSASGCALMRVALGGGTALALPHLRLQRQSPGGVRRLVAGVAVGRPARRRRSLTRSRWLSPADWKRRLALAAVAGIVVAAFHALMWPHCLQRLEGVSPEVERLWLSHVKEARPFYRTAGASPR